jgi:hypothetical protein
MADGTTALPGRGFGQTLRVDPWWLQPAAVFTGLFAFIVYSTWAAFQGEHYTYGNYISPFYSPELFGDSPHSWFGPKPGWFPSWLPWSPAFLILWAPGGFRLTCYYYRGAYYKAFWGAPPACAVGKPHKKYSGETRFPLILQNLHRYFLYLALLFLVFLAWDAWRGLWFADAAGIEHLGLGVGSLVLIGNVTFLGLYTFSCHSLRHFVGGCLDRPSEKPVRQAMYGCVSALNRKHMLFAWISLFWVGFSDVYVRLCSMGVIRDVRLLG